MEEKCEGCCYFNFAPGTGAGICVRFPPTVIMDRLRGFQYYQPKVKNEDVCGEFHPSKESESAQAEKEFKERSESEEEAYKRSRLALSKDKP